MESPRTRPSCPIKKKIINPPEEEIPHSKPVEKQEKPSPESLEASLEAQAEALASSLPGDSPIEEPPARGKSELARHKANQEAIDQLVAKLPDGVRKQMDELFRARYTRIQKLELEQPE